MSMYADLRGTLIQHGIKHQLTDDDLAELHDSILCDLEWDYENTPEEDEYRRECFIHQYQTEKEPSA